MRVRIRTVLCTVCDQDATHKCHTGQKKAESACDTETLLPLNMLYTSMYVLVCEVHSGLDLCTCVCRWCAVDCILCNCVQRCHCVACAVVQTAGAGVGTSDENAINTEGHLHR